MSGSYFGQYFRDQNQPIGRGYFGSYFGEEPPVIPVNPRGTIVLPPYSPFVVQRTSDGLLVLYRKLARVTISAGSAAAYYTLDGTKPQAYFEAIRYRGSFDIVSNVTLSVLFVTPERLQVAVVRFINLDKN